MRVTEQLARLGIDLDGPAHDFVGGIHAFLKATDHPGVPEDFDGLEVDDYHWHDEWDIDFDTVHAEATEQGFAYGSTHLDDAASWVRMLHALGHPIHIVTSRPRMAVAPTIEWLDLHDFPYDSLTFSKDKTIVRTDAFVEDHVGNYHELEDSGSIPFLVTRGWNRESPGALFRVDDIGQFARMVAGRTAGDLRAEREEWLVRARKLVLLTT